MSVKSESIKISDTIWELPPACKEGMRVPARIFATEKLLREMDINTINDPAGYRLESQP